MQIIQITTIGIIASIISLLLKKHNPELSIVIGLISGVIIFMMVMPELKSVIEMMSKVFENISLDNVYIGIVLKIIGIAYIAEFGVQVCKDSGEGAIASKIELAGKVMVMILSAPIFLALIEVMTTLIQ